MKRQDHMKPFKDKLRKIWISENLLTKGQGILNVLERENLINTGRL